jgi:DNA-binding transcriptional MerR regulator
MTPSSSITGWDHQRGPVACGRRPSRPHRRDSRTGGPLSHPAAGLTIGQAAAFADVTIKTVRHYHKLGAVDEPARDSSGYRRYGSDDLLRLVQVQTLAAAGVPLAEIGSLLDSDAASFAASLADVERRLTERIDELAARRTMLHRLASGDRALLPDRAVALLEGMPSIGFTPHDVTIARESFVLAKALVPEGFDNYLTHVEHALQDPRFVALTKRTAEAAGWEPDHPRVADLATDMADHYLGNTAQLEIVTGLQARTEAATRYRLIAHHGEQRESAAARLAALVETKLRSAGVHISKPDSP